MRCFCKLEPLSPDEIREYLYHRLAKAGLAEQRLFRESVVPLIHDYTRGIPRLVNSLCDTALGIGFALQSREVTAAILEEAAKDLDLQVASGTPIAPLDSSMSEPVSVMAEHTSLNGGTGSDMRIPLESYASRQKSLGFLGSLMERWK